MRTLIAATLIAPLATVAGAQTMDITDYQEIQDADVVTESGESVGEIEEVLIDGSGDPVAVVMEVDAGFLDLGDSDVVMNLEDLTWENGSYTTSMSQGQVESLPEWDD